MDTTTFSSEIAQHSYWNASPAVREVLLDAARMNVRAREAAMISMEGRISQAAVALFAAAAFSATFAAQFRTAELPLAFLGGLATVSFVAGTLSALSAMRVGDLVFPGASPSWWDACDFLGEEQQSEEEGVGMGAQKALTWLAAQLEQAIESYDEVSRRRGERLNLGLKYGAAGAIIMAFAGAILIFA